MKKNLKITSICLIFALFFPIISGFAIAFADEGQAIAPTDIVELFNETNTFECGNCTLCRMEGNLITNKSFYIKFR